MTTTSTPTDFAGAKGVIRTAKLPQEVFGDLAFQDEASAKTGQTRVTKVYRRLAALVHPDRNQGNETEAEELFKRLTELHDEAEAIVNRALGIQAKPKDTFPITFRTKKNTYILHARKASGDMCGIFEGTVTDKKGMTVPIILKVPHTPEDNDLMRREADVFVRFRKKFKEISTSPDGEAAADKFARRLPLFLESVTLEEPGGGEAKIANAFALRPQLETGWYTLEDIRRHHPDGVTTRVMCFIWNRLLEALTFAHATGVTHNAITPDHVLIHAKDHCGNLIDWTAATVLKDREGPPYIDEDRYGDFFPDELLHPEGVPTPATDIYMSAWCMVYLLGGNPEDRLIPDTVEEPILEFLNKCLQPKQKMRPRTAVAAYEEFQQVSKAVFGPKKFVELEMPES